MDYVVDSEILQMALKIKNKSIDPYRHTYESSTANTTKKLFTTTKPLVFTETLTFIDIILFINYNLIYTADRKTHKTQWRNRC